MGGDEPVDPRGVGRAAGRRLGQPLDQGPRVGPGRGIVGQAEDAAGAVGVADLQQAGELGVVDAHHVGHRHVAVEHTELGKVHHRALAELGDEAVGIEHRRLHVEIEIALAPRG